MIIVLIFIIWTLDQNLLEAHRNAQEEKRICNSRSIMVAAANCIKGIKNCQPFQSYAAIVTYNNVT